MLRNRLVSQWVLGVWAMESKPKEEDWETREDYGIALQAWFNDTIDLFNKLSSDMEYIVQSMTGTNRSYNHQEQIISTIELILQDQTELQKFWNRQDKYHNPPSGPQTSGSMAFSGARGLRISGGPNPAKISFDKRQEQIQSILDMEDKIARQDSKRPKGLSTAENRFYNISKIASSFPREWFNMIATRIRKKALGLR
jgi:hypothetical protein